MVCFTTSVFGQNLKIKQAESYFNSFRFAEATPIYQELIQKDAIRIAENELVYRHAIIAANESHNFDFEYAVLTALSQSDKYTFEDAYTYFQLSIFLGLYDKAKEILNSPIVVNSTDLRKGLLNEYKIGNSWEDLKKDTSDYKISKSDFNSEYSDFDAIFHPKGIVFSSSRDLSFRKSVLDNSAYLNLYLFSKETGKVEELKFLGINHHDGTVFYDSTNQIWYYTKNFPSDKKKKLTTTGIFMYDEKTKMEIPFAFNTPDFFLAQPYLSEDGQTLWFSSDRVGGFGKADIWFSKKSGDSWTEPINAGSLVNSFENEMFPFFQKRILYFSSNGHPGLGGLDLFSVINTNGTMTQLKNLGGGINSNYDDFSLKIDGTEKTGYFSSNREAYTDDIYTVLINKNQFLFKGTLVTDSKDKQRLSKILVLVKKDNVIVDSLFADKDGNFIFEGEKESNYNFEIDDNEFAPLKVDYSTVGKTESDTIFSIFDLQSRFVDVKSTVYDEKSNLPLANTKVELINKSTGEKTTYVTDTNGMFQAKLPRNNEFDVNSTHKGYIDNHSDLSTVTKEKEMKSSVKMKDIKVDSHLMVQELKYDFNKWELKPDSKIELNKVVTFLKENPTVKIEFSSYTDARGSDEYNLMLSKKRTQTSVNYLISQGISQDRIVGKWFGETVLLNHCKDGVTCTDLEHSVNRRTLIIILSVE